MSMRFLAKVTGSPPHFVQITGPRHCLQHRIAAFLLALMTVLPANGWSNNTSPATGYSGNTKAVDQTGGIDPRENDPLVPAAASPPGPEGKPTEAETRQAFSGHHDLVLGKAVFNHACLTCHGNSVRDAPRVGDMAAWQARLAQGLDVLIRHALDGHGRMPPRGGYITLTDHEVSSAVAYVYQMGTEILAKQGNPVTHEGCDLLSNLKQCTPEEVRKLLILQMLWLLSGPRQ